MASQQHDLPKSILKSSTGYTQSLSRAKSPELRGIKLIKSVLKRESEEQPEQLMTATLSNLEVHPRSILKSNPHSRLAQTANVADDATASRTEASSARVIENQNQSSEITKLCEKSNDSDATNMVARHSSQCPCDDVRAIVSKEGDTSFVEDVAASSQKVTRSQNDEISPDNVDNFKIDAVPSFVPTKRHGNKRNENPSEGKSNRTSDVGDKSDNDDYDENKNDDKFDDNENKDINKGEENEEEEKEEDEEEAAAEHDDDDHASSSSGGEIRDIDVVDEKRVGGAARCPANSLAKSVSQHSFGDDSKRRQQQRGLPLPGLCRSATQVLASIETSETPSVSIADRLAALRHNGSTNWKRRVAGGRPADETCDETSPFGSADECATPVKSGGVLANCLEKLESATENWRSRIAASDAINFTVAGKMKVTTNQSMDVVTSPFLPKATPSVASQKKKMPRPQRFRTRRGKTI